MKTKTKLMISLLLLAFIFIISCTEVTENYNDGEMNGRVIGSIHGVVTDANTNARIDSALVTWFENGEIKSTITDELGYFDITDLFSGNYEISFSGNSEFAISRISVNIPTLDELNEGDLPTDEDFYYTVQHDVSLYGLNANLIGIIYVQPDDENINLAPGVTVIADFGNYDISPNQFTTTTDSSGNFVFSNIPSTPDGGLIVLPFCDGIYTYASFQTTINLIPNGITNAGNITLQIAPDAPFIVQNNFMSGNFCITDDIILTFSKPMQTSTFEINLAGSAGDVEFESIWDNDITLTINPCVPLQANSIYNLILEGESEDNNEFTGNYDIETQEGIIYLWTNLERVDGVFDEFPVNENIIISFSMEVDLSNYNGYVNLYNATNEPVYTDLYTDTTTLIIDPIYDLNTNSTYHLDFKVYSEIEGDYATDEDIIIPLQFTTSSDVTVPTQITGFSIDYSVMGTEWKADFNTTEITFIWNTLNNAEEYRIYAKDSYNISDFICIASVNAIDYVTLQNEDVNLPAQFDYYSDDDIQTPFNAGTEVTFKILAYNEAGEGTFSDGIYVVDETAPSGTLTQNGTANNPDTTNTMVFTISFSSNEYLDNINPIYSFIENGGDTTYVLPHSAAVFEWDSNMMGGLFTITVPDGKNGSVDIFSIDDFKDTSNNITETPIEIILY